MARNYLTDSRVPLWMPELADFRTYMIERDLGAPTAVPVPLDIVTAPYTNVVLVTLTWDYGQEFPPRGLGADGFAVWYSIVPAGEVPEVDPVATSFLLPQEARSATILVPSPCEAQFALTAWRFTHNGMRETEKVTPSEWLVTIS